MIHSIASLRVLEPPRLAPKVSDCRVCDLHLTSAQLVGDGEVFEWIHVACWEWAVAALQAVGRSRVGAFLKGPAL